MKLKAVKTRKGTHLSCPDLIELQAVQSMHSNLYKALELHDLYYNATREKWGVTLPMEMTGFHRSVFSSDRLFPD